VPDVCFKVLSLVYNSVKDKIQWRGVSELLCFFIAAIKDRRLISTLPWFFNGSPSSKIFDFIVDVSFKQMFSTCTQVAREASELVLLLVKHSSSLKEVTKIFLKVQEEVHCVI